MLRILGTGRSLSHHGRGGLDRREMLRVGGLGLAGSLTGGSILPAAKSVPTPGFESTFGRAKNCILLYIYGAWSQLHTLDPKPDAPEEIRGEFGTIASKLSGVRVMSI